MTANGPITARGGQTRWFIFYKPLEVKALFTNYSGLHMGGVYVDET